MSPSAWLRSRTSGSVRAMQLARGEMVQAREVITDGLRQMTGGEEVGVAGAVLAADLRRVVVHAHPLADRFEALRDVAVHEEGQQRAPWLARSHQEPARRGLEGEHDPEVRRVVTATGIPRR